jgi:hypothetical protein
MADTLSYAYQGEWSEALQTKLNQWFTKQSRFLKEMQFEEQLFRDFITVSSVENCGLGGFDKKVFQFIGNGKGQAKING